MTQSWNPTHRLTCANGDSIEVMLVDDTEAYTSAEWETARRLTPDFERDEHGQWLFLGKPFAGTVEEVK